MTNRLGLSCNPPRRIQSLQGIVCTRGEFRPTLSSPLPNIHSHIGAFAAYDTCVGVFTFALS
jgi:hypothetical protein